MQAGRLTADDVRAIRSDSERRRVIIEAIYPDLRALCRKSSMLRGTVSQYDTFDDAVQAAALSLCERAGEYDPDYQTPDGKPVKPLTRLLWLIRSDMQQQLTQGRRMPTVFGERSRRLVTLADNRASEADPAVVLGVPVQRELF